VENQEACLPDDRKERKKKSRMQRKQKKINTLGERKRSTNSDDPKNVSGGLGPRGGGPTGTDQKGGLQTEIRIHLREIEKGKKISRRKSRREKSPRSNKKKPFIGSKNGQRKKKKTGCFVGDLIRRRGDKHDAGVAAAERKKIYPLKRSGGKRRTNGERHALPDPRKLAGRTTCPCKQKKSPERGMS